MTLCVRVTEHEDLSLNPQDPSKKVSIAMRVPIAPGLLGESGWRWEDDWTGAC